MNLTAEYESAVANWRYAKEDAERADQAHDMPAWNWHHMHAQIYKEWVNYLKERIEQFEEVS